MLTSKYYRLNTNIFARFSFAGSEEPAELAERAALPVLQRRTGTREGCSRTDGLRGLFPGRLGRQTVRPRSAKAAAAASRQRVRSRRSREWTRQRVLRRRRRQRRRLRRPRRRRRRRVGRADRQVRRARVRTVPRQIVLAVAPRHGSRVVVGGRRLRSLAGLRERPMTMRRYQIIIIFIINNSVYINTPLPKFTYIVRTILRVPLPQARLTYTLASSLDLYLTYIYS